jgi:dCTP deaminase
VTAGAVGPGVLTKADIEAHMIRRPLSERLIITPLLNPKESVGPSSVDVRLGNQFLIFKRESFEVMDVGLPTLESYHSHRYQERIVRRVGEKFVLHPRQLVIGSTLEYIQIPRGLMCYVVGKSSWGRMGLIIATATKVDPGFKGCITLEIVNEGEIPLILYPGLPIAQLVFHAGSKDATYDGSYKCPIGPEFPKLKPGDKRWSFWTGQ